MNGYERNDAELKRLLRTASGQIEGVVKMIDEKKYCIDISNQIMSNQIMAAQAILAKVNKEILNAHLSTCVVNSVKEGDASAKLKEMSKILDKIVR